MEDYGAMIRNTFELGSVRDAEAPRTLPSSKVLRIIAP